MSVGFSGEGTADPPIVGGGAMTSWLMGIDGVPNAEAGLDGGNGVKDTAGGSRDRFDALLVRGMREIGAGVAEPVLLALIGVDVKS